MKTLLRLRVLGVVCTMLAAAAPSRAQQIETLKSGDCAVKITLPIKGHINFATLRLFKDDTESDIAPHIASTKNDVATVDFHLSEPVILGSQITITYEVLENDKASFRRAQAIVDTIGAGRSSCKEYDERGNFEPALFYGVSADAFAPADDLNYPPGTAYPLRASQATGLLADIRVGGTSERWLSRLWVSVAAVYGERSADLDCAGQDKESALCTGNAFATPGNQGKAVTANVLRASRIATASALRYEIKTVNRNTEVPVTFFITERLGFLQFPDQAKPATLFGVGGGFLFPGGPYRDTSFTYLFGQDHSYHTHPHGYRSKMEFRFLFNVLPDWKDQLPFLAGTSRTLRGMIQVNVDRNFFGPGPDSVQTYLGLVLDFHQLFGGGR